MASLVVNTGKAITTSRMRGLGTEPVFVGIGTAAGTTAATDTTLFTEDYTASNTGTQNTRVTGTSSQVTTTTTNDTYQVVGTVTAAHATGVTNAGLFDTNGLAANLVTAPSGGNLYAKGDFSVINLSTSDTLALTFKAQYS